MLNIKQVYEISLKGTSCLCSYSQNHGSVKHDPNSKGCVCKSWRHPPHANFHCGRVNHDCFSEASPDELTGKNLVVVWGLPQSCNRILIRVLFQPLLSTLIVIGQVLIFCI